MDEFNFEDVRTFAGEILDITKTVNCCIGDEPVWAYDENDHDSNVTMEIGNVLLVAGSTTIELWEKVKKYYPEEVREDLTREINKLRRNLQEG